MQTATGLLAGGASLSLASSSTARAGEFTGKIRKAVKYHMIQEKLSAEDKLKMLKRKAEEVSGIEQSIHSLREESKRIKDEIVLQEEKNKEPAHYGTGQ